MENYFEPGGFVPPHYHPIEEILICLEGKGIIVADGKEISFPAGSSAVIPAGVVHSIFNIGENKMRMFGKFPDSEPKGTWV